MDPVSWLFVIALILGLVATLYLSGRGAGASIPGAISATEQAAATRPATVVRVYRGRQQSDAVRAMQPDAQALGAQGYMPTSQSWAQGQWGCGAFLVALILVVVVIGILVFIYMLLVKPEGTLTVTYALRDEAAAPAPAPIREDIGVMLNTLADLRDRGAITPEEFDAKKNELLARM